MPIRWQPPAFTLALLLLGPSSAAQEGIQPGLSGEVLLDSLVAVYGPAAGLSIEQARDTLLAVVDASATSDQTEGFFSGLEVSLDCDQPCDPSEAAYANGRLLAASMWPQEFGAQAGLIASDLHHLVPAREPILNARAGRLYGESPDAQTALWFRLDLEASTPPTQDIEAWTEVGDVVEPREGRKGDAARAVFYTYTMYGPAGTGQLDPAPFEAMKEALLAWHEADPVTSEDLARSERVGGYQTTTAGAPQLNPFVHDATLARRAFFASPVVYVRPLTSEEESNGGRTIATGTSWSTAYAALQDAVRAGADYDHVTEVWIAAGTYSPGPAEGATFRLPADLGLYGGFLGTEAARDQRDPEAARSVLTGERGLPDDSTDNAGAIVTIEGTSDAPLVGVVLDGLTISDGYSTASFTRGGAGGLFAQNAEVTVRNCTFLRNYGRIAGGISFVDVSGRIEGSVFDQNASEQTGGAAVYGGTLILQRTAFHSNVSTGRNGGGLNLQNSEAQLTEVTFERNRTAGLGGGLHVSTGRTAIANASFLYNRAGAGRSSFGNSGGGAFIDLSRDFSLHNALLVGNTAGSGSALQVLAGEVELSSLTVAYNGAGTTGGSAIEVDRLNGETVSLTNSIVWGNAQASIDDTGFAFIDGGARRSVTTRNITEFIEGELLLDANLLEGGCPTLSLPPGAPSPLICGPPLDADPTFERDPAPGTDGLWGTQDDDPGDLRLGRASVAVNSGQTLYLPADRLDLDGDEDLLEPLPTDFDGDPRVQQQRPDLGAFESPHRGAGPVLFVDARAPEGGNGRTWRGAFRRLQDALDLAQSEADIVDEIWIADGTYTPGPPYEPGTPTDRSAHFALVEGVGIYGGFSGTETDRSERDWSTFRTVLSGDIGIEGAPEDNAYRIVAASGLDSTAVLDGVTVTGARGAGGIVVDGGNPTFRHLLVTDNSASSGGGASVTNSRPSFIDVTFLRNRVTVITGSGGGMAVRDGSPTLLNTRFYGNTAGVGGGALYVRGDAAPLVANTVFVGNDGGPIGGAVYAVFASPVLINVTATENVGRQDGGGALYAGQPSSRPIVRNSIFWSNTAPEVAAADATPSVETSLVTGGYPQGADILSSDPRFVRSPDAGPDERWGTEDDDYGDLRLEADSPAIDSGRDTDLPADVYDLDADGDRDESLPIDALGGERANGSPDLGAYESPFASSGEGDATGAGSDRLSIAPNPARVGAELTLVSTESRTVTVEVYDTLGRRVADLFHGDVAPGVSLRIPLGEGLPAGTYVVRALGDGLLLARPFTIVR